MLNLTFPIKKKMLILNCNNHYNKKILCNNIIIMRCTLIIVLLFCMVIVYILMLWNFVMMKRVLRLLAFHFNWFVLWESENVCKQCTILKYLKSYCVEWYSLLFFFVSMADFSSQNLYSGYQANVIKWGFFWHPLI